MKLRDQMSKLRTFASEALRHGHRYARNMAHFRTHYMTRDDNVIDSIYRKAELPGYVEIEVTTHCNLRCRICEHTYWSETARHMPFENFQGIIGQFPKLRWIGLTGIGESFLHPRFDDMVRLVKQRNAFLELYDTFFFIDREKAEFLIDQRCDRLIISLDAASADTYRQLRVGSDFERVTGNLRRMFDLKHARGATKPELEFHFIVNTLNAHEMLPFLHLAKDISGGDTRVTFTRMLHVFPEVRDLYIEIPAGQQADVMAEAGRIGLPCRWNADTLAVKPPCTTCTAWTMPFIFVTGEVIPCCSMNEANRREQQKATSMGNIFEDSLEDIWNGPRYRELRESLRAGRFPECCRGCCLYCEGTRG